MRMSPFALPNEATTTSTMNRRVRLRAVLGLLALCDYPSFTSRSTPVLCEAFTTTRNSPVRIQSLRMSTTSSDPNLSSDWSSLSSTSTPSSSSSSSSSIPASTLSSSSSLTPPSLSTQRTGSTELSSSSVVDSRTFSEVRSVGETVSEAREPAVNYQWTKQNMAIALPALMGLLADPVLSMVDTGFVGRLRSIDLAALGVCTSIFHMAFTVFRASTVATTSLVASAKSKQEARKITKISLQMAGVLGTMVLLVLRLGGPSILATMGVAKTSPLYKPACDYLFARCWAAPAVVGIVVAEGAFRGGGDSRTPLIASGVAALINLILDPIFMFPMRMGMMGAAAATALSQIGGAGVYGWRLFKRKLLPQKDDISTVSVSSVLKAIIGANLAMLAKQGSLLVFYTYATALATRMGPAHVATHQVALSFFWLVTYWLDSGSVSGQVLMSQSLSDVPKARSLTKYMAKYAAIQGLAISALVAGVGNFIPAIFTKDLAIRGMLFKIMPHIAFQQTLISLCLVMEGLAIGGNQFRFMAGGTIAATLFGMRQLSRATSAIGIWSNAVTAFFGARFLFALIGVARVHLNLRKGINQPTEEDVVAAAVL